MTEKTFNTMFSLFHEVYNDMNEDLQFYAEKIKVLNKARDALRDYVRDLRDFERTQQNEAKAKALASAIVDISEKTILLLKEASKDLNKSKVNRKNKARKHFTDLIDQLQSVNKELEK